MNGSQKTNVLIREGKQISLENGVTAEATGGMTWIQDQDERYWDSNPQSDTHELSDFGQVTQVAFSLTPTRKQQLKMNPSFHFCGESKNDLENNQKNKQRNKNKWD